MNAAVRVLSGRDVLLRNAETQLKRGIASHQSQVSFDDDSEGPALVAPPTIDEAALHGPVGDWVRTLAPHTEASIAGLLFSALTAIGVLVGRGPSITLDGARHGLNLFTLMIGRTSSGRKGTAWAHTRRLLREIDADFATKNVITGLSSGEGLINAIRDPSEKRGERGADPGVVDKRVLVSEHEFGGVLKKQSRDGNTLSHVIREAWDGNDLCTMTKGNPQRATDPHVGIIAQITPDELGRGLKEGEFQNGGVNRFLFVWCERSQFLPFGGTPDEGALRTVAAKIAQAVKRSERAGHIEPYTPAAYTWWQDHYRGLATVMPGRAGAATQRGPAQVQRLALLFALLDEARARDQVHFEAALAVWRYSEATAKYVFGNSELSEKALRLETALLESGPQGMDRRTIRQEVFGSNNVGGQEIVRVLNELREVGSAVQISEKGKGRPREVWIHMQHIQAPALGIYGSNGKEAPPGDGVGADFSHKSHNSQEEFVV